jgi:hypothetical protein
MSSVDMTVAMYAWLAVALVAGIGAAICIVKGLQLRDPDSKPKRKLWMPPT